MIPIYKPYLPPHSLRYAHEALDSSWISSQGQYIQLAKDKLQELLNVKHCLLVNNGTSACHLAAKGLVKKLNTNKKNLILVPDNAYVAAWNGFLFDKEFKLITVKTDMNTWNIDLDDLDLKITKYPEASVLIVHNMGNIVNVPRLQKKYPNTIFVEDACEGFGGTYDNSYAGTSSFVNAFSTFANKTITSGEGGFITTNDDLTYEYLKKVHAQGQSEKRFVHDELGYNYRITNIQSAILYGQLEILQEIIEKKNNIFEYYRNSLKNRDDIVYQSLNPNTSHANWLFGVRIKNNSSFENADIYFKNNGIEIRPMFYEMSRHSYFTQNIAEIDDCNNATILNKECIILPSYPELKRDEQVYILNILDKYVRNK